MRRLKAKPAEFNGESSHVHLLVHFPPKAALSRLVNSVRGVASRRTRQGFRDLRRHYWAGESAVARSYLAGSVGGAPTSVLRQHVEQQSWPACARAKARPPSPPA